VRFERGEVKMLLILSDSPDASLNEALLLSAGGCIGSGSGIRLGLGALRVARLDPIIGDAKVGRKSGFLELRCEQSWKRRGLLAIRNDRKCNDGQTYYDRSLTKRKFVQGIRLTGRDFP
jgi:hypothetical protein